ncbi:MAG TPA: TlpA disulfide reductase family protein, partial [Actinomycetota bacterium]|nr:TlpA disulfide reductase family protein [Actinomycetota bacterium]
DELEEYPRTNRRVRLIAFSIALAMVVAALSTLLLRPASRDAPDRLPEFSLEYLSGQGSLTSGELEGSPVVLNFWASWCGPCRDEAPAFQDAWERYDPEGVRFVGVNVCDLEPEAKKFVREFEIGYDVVRDPDQELADALGIECRLPQTFFVAPSGEFAATSEGEEVDGALGGGGGVVVLGGIEPEELEARIEELLSEEADA